MHQALTKIQFYFVYHTSPGFYSLQLGGSIFLFPICLPFAVLIPSLSRVLFCIKIQSIFKRPLPVWFQLHLSVLISNFNQNGNNLPFSGFSIIIDPLRGSVLLSIYHSVAWSHQLTVCVYLIFNLHSLCNLLSEYQYHFYSLFLVASGTHFLLCSLPWFGCLFPYFVMDRCISNRSDREIYWSLKIEVIVLFHLCHSNPFLFVFVQICIVLPSFCCYFESLSLWESARNRIFYAFLYSVSIRECAKHREWDDVIYV